MFVKLKVMESGKWTERTVELSECEAYQGKDAVAMIADGYVFAGNKKWYDYYIKQGYDVITTVALADIMAHARMIFKENRDERRSICEADNVPQETINNIFEQYPLMYGAK